MSTIKKIVGWSLISLGCIGIIYLGFQSLKTVIELKDQLKSGHSPILFSGVDIFFYFILLIWVICFTYFSPLSSPKKIGAVALLFCLMAGYEIFYDAISMGFVDLWRGDQVYSVCIKMKKTMKGNFGSNYVLVTNNEDCEKITEFRKNYFTSKELEDYIQKLNSRTN